jgi:hypothetical protein
VGQVECWPSLHNSNFLSLPKKGALEYFIDFDRLRTRNEERMGLDTDKSNIQNGVQVLQSTHDEK